MVTLLWLNGELVGEEKIDMYRNLFMYWFKVNIKKDRTLSH